MADPSTKREEQTKGALAPLRSAPEFLQLVLDTNPSLIFVKDFDGRFILVNKATAEIYGTTAENLIGRTDADFNPNSDQVEQFRAADREVIQSKQPKLIPEEPVTDARTGKVRWFQTHKVPLHDSSGRVEHLLGVSTDITERKHAEEGLADALDQLLQAQKMESIGRFAGGIAHDFNNLLTVIIGSCEQLYSSLKTDDLNLRTVKRIGACADRAATLVQHLLAFGRKQMLQPKVFDLSSFVREAKPILERLMDEAIEISISLDSVPCPVNADPTQIQQVLLNLAVNAKDAMPHGGHLRIGVKNESGVDDGSNSNSKVCLTVSDTGCGMNADLQSKIFEPFFTTKPVGKGTGLGLSTVYGIITQSGGTIRVDSEADHGTTFTIILPRSPEISDIQPENDPPGALPRGSEMILLVEDQAAVSEVVKHSLERLGYEVLTASNSMEALSVSTGARDKVHLVITDVVMPGGSGPLLAEQLLLEAPQLKILFMSGYAEDSIFEKGVINPEVHFLQKPFTASELARKVRLILDS